MEIGRVGLVIVALDADPERESGVLGGGENEAHPDVGVERPDGDILPGVVNLGLKDGQAKDGGRKEDGETDPTSDHLNSRVICPTVS
jgi:hypothetical protein